MTKTISLNGRKVGEGEPIYIIAEGGVTNFGELDLAKLQVDSAMAAGCDAIKFQAQTTEALVSKKVDPYWYKRMKYKELSYDELKELKDYCSIRNIEFFATGHTKVDTDFLADELDVPFLKVGGGEITNHDFLKTVGSKGKPVIISLGLCKDLKDAKAAVKVLEDAGCKDIVIMHCNSIYPTPPHLNNLGFIKTLKENFDYPIGYSDHTIGWHLVLAAVAMGATVIEKHLSFDLEDLRSLDSVLSVTPETLKIMVSEIRDIETALQDPGQEYYDHLDKGRSWARQSIVAAKDIRKGEKITQEMLAFKRPGKGMAPNEADKIIGKKAKKDIDEDELIFEKDVI